MHLKTSHYLYLALFIVLVAAFLLSARPSSRGPALNEMSDTLVSNSALSPNESALKEQILERLDTKKSLTVEEKRSLAESLKGYNFNRFDFTEAEQVKIVNALNGK